MELHLALSRKQNKKVLVLADDNLGRIPADLDNIHIIFHRGKKHSKEFSNTQADENQLIPQLEHWFNIQAQLVAEVLSNEPERLILKKEYRAAIISATTLLENTLRNQLETEVTSSNSIMTLRQMIDTAVTHDLITPNETALIRKLIESRNRTIHLGENVSPKDAKSMVEKVIEIVNRILKNV